MSKLLKGIALRARRGEKKEPLHEVDHRTLAGGRGGRGGERRGDGGKETPKGGGA
jgi:hypothetical protein